MKTEEKDLTIRPAQKGDLSELARLLRQVLELHHKGRPDLFRPDTRKYTDEELLALIGREERPVFVAADREDHLLGYAFCILSMPSESHIFHPRKELYLDDLCVEEGSRGLGTGKKLYAYVENFAREQGCYHLTLNVWSCNPGAEKFYRACGLIPQKITMEKILETK